ncbi:uncharacterized protein RAG0_01700 [Rhynchosporium agropyri]|uniref:Uncharacterized protein n=1 Tax=Rhynchosporium agropyri TaxID=914238 RepID=A0A1E1JY42_9HELO|nr:uncharacterized protein RAG0_01700 [Rhynchosporium agropyri]
MLCDLIMESASASFVHERLSIIVNAQSGEALAQELRSIPIPAILLPN